MRVTLWVAAAIFASVVAFYAAVIIASESDEVVLLRTGSGTEARSTRLWLVDHDDAEWVRTGHSGKGWYRQAQANPSVELDRDGEVSPRIAVPVLDPQISQAVNEVFREKYGNADWFVALSGDAAQRIVVRLDPVP